MTGIDNSVNNIVVESFAYAYDALNRPTSRNADTFGYNDRSEVTNAIVSGQAEFHAYDEIGNSIWGGTISNGYSYVSNSRNQYSEVWYASDWGSPSDPVASAYDADGNMTQFGGWTYSYDAANRLKTVSTNGVLLLTNFYDAKSRRVKKVTPEATTTFFYDDWNLIEERIAYTNGTSSTIRYYWGKDISGTLQGAGNAPVAEGDQVGRMSEANEPRSGRKSPRVGGLLYLTVSNSSTPNSSTQQLCIPFYDNIGNVTHYLDENGNTVAQYTYDAFGKLIAKSGPIADFFRHRFSTKYFDPETGLYYYGYRFYCPAIMRWLTRDPIGEEGGLNLYAMCENNTVLYHDALGEARMITGSLFALKGTKRIIFSGYNHARNIIRLVDKLNNIYVAGQKVYDAKICDLVTTPVSSLKKEIAANANNVYIIAHGGLVINNKIFRGRHYLWNESDSVDERIFPTGKPPGIDVHSLGANMDNVFGCYISAAVRKVPSRTLWKTQYTSSVDDYGRMYKALYSRLARYAVNPQPSKCPVRIRIFEGENANELNKSYAETENALRQHPIRDEEEYK